MWCVTRERGGDGAEDAGFETCGVSLLSCCNRDR